MVEITMIRTVVNSLLPFPVIPRPGILFGSKWKREEVAKLLAGNKIIQDASNIRSPKPPIEFAMELITGIPQDSTSFKTNARKVHAFNPEITDLVGKIHDQAHHMNPNLLLELASGIKILSKLPPVGEYVEKAQDRGLVPYAKLVIAATKAMGTDPQQISFIERGKTTLNEGSGMTREAYDAIFTLGNFDLICRNGIPIAFNKNGLGRTHTFAGNFLYDAWGRVPIEFPDKQQRLLV